jgi:predicted lipoprotein with Yx(FWY)xxD motif
MKRILTSLAVLSAGIAAVAGVATTSHAGASRAGSSIGVRKTSHGRILVDTAGRTLYLFEADKANMSNCSSSCLSVWPALTAHVKPHARSGASASKIGTISVAHGKRQVTYAGHPLYYYVGDRKPGQTNGQGLNQFGAKWYVLSPGGRKIDDD